MGGGGRSNPQICLVQNLEDKLPFGRFLPFSLPFPIYLPGQAGTLIFKFGQIPILISSRILILLSGLISNKKRPDICSNSLDQAIKDHIAFGTGLLSLSREMS